MTLQELFKRMLVDSGQFLLLQAGLDTIEMNPESFQLMVGNCLEIYNSYDPLDRRFNVISDFTSYTFIGGDWEIPVFIAEIIPVVISGLPWYFQNWMTWQGKGFGDEFNPLSAIWRYNRPTLTFEYSGTFTVWATFNRPLIRFAGAWVNVTSYNTEETVDVVINGGTTYACKQSHTSASNNEPGVGANWTSFWSIYPYTPKSNLTVPYFDIPNISTKDRNLLKLILGRFFQSLGTSRNTFILNEVPVTSNASELISRGEKLEEKAIEDMQAQGKWYIAQA